MLDFTITQPSRETNLYCFLLYLIIVFVNYYSYDKGLRSNRQHGFLLFGIVLFAVTSWIPGDWFHYQASMKFMFVEARSEVIYLYLRRFLNYNYLLFRIVVWGLAAVLNTLAFKRLSLNIHNALFILFACFALLFSYARASLAMAVFYLGYSFVCKYKEFDNKIKFIVIGYGILLLSQFFHRSMIVLTAFSLVAFVPIKRKTIPLIIIIAAGVFYVGVAYLNEIVAMDMFTDEGIAGRLESADLEMEKKMNIQLVARYASIYVPLFFITLSFFRKTTRRVLPDSMINMYKLTVVVVSFALSMNIAFSNDVFYYRTLYMAVVPICVLLSYLYSHKLLKKIEWYLSIFVGISYHIITLGLLAIR